MVYLIFIPVVFLFLTLSVVYIVKYVKILKITKGFYHYGRIGFIEGTHGYSGKYRFNVVEIEKLKNGYSRIKIFKKTFQKCDSSDKVSINESYKFILSDGIIKTGDVIWLERDEDLADVRRKKLGRLLDKIKM